jgi:hypothetical protein
MKSNCARVIAIGCATVAASAVLLTFSQARASGRVRNAQAGVMHRVVFRLQANVAYTFTTEDLSAGSDTILHVLSYPSGAFVAGNDDFCFTPPPDGGPAVCTVASRATVAAVASPRDVYLVVRGKPGTPPGSANLRTLGLSGLTVVRNTVTSIQFSQGVVQSVGSLAAGTHVTTVEETFGTRDTIAMVVGANSAITLAFDDDDGIDQMSFMRLATACASSCQIVVGTPNPSIRTPFSPPPAGAMTLVWDESIEVADSDHDGLGDQFEATVTLTLPQNRDSDADGLADGFEVYGAAFTGGGRQPPVLPGAGKDNNLLKLPRYGADPLLPDVFVEVDWAPACPGNVTTCPTGSFVGTKDGLKFVDTQLQSARNAMVTALFRPHFDAGVPTTPGDLNAQFGDWGGANRLADGDVTFVSQTTPAGVSFITGVYSPDDTFGQVECGKGATVARGGFFHHFISVGSRPRSPYGGCGTTFNDGGTFTHELGHNFNLRHGGPANVPDHAVNCKVSHGSVMSYPNQFINAFGRGYSRGVFAGLVMNGIFMDEATGLGTTDPAIRGVFGAPGGSFNRGFLDPAFPTGIDWNMDGRIDVGAVRAPANWAGSNCGAPYWRANWRLMLPSPTNNVPQVGGVTFPTLTVAEANAAPPQIFAIGSTGSPTASDAALVTGTGDTSNCQQGGLNTCTRWTSRQAVTFGGGGGPCALPAGFCAGRCWTNHGVPRQRGTTDGVPQDGHQHLVEATPIGRYWGNGRSRCDRGERRRQGLCDQRRPITALGVR